MGRKKKNQEEDNVEESNPKIELGGDVKRSIAAVVLFALAIISVLAFFGAAGSFGNLLNKAVAYFIGWVKFIFPVFLIIAGIVLVLRKETSFYVTKLIGLGVALLSFTGFFHWFFDFEKLLENAKLGQGGGYVGYVLDYLLIKNLGNAGSFVALLAIFLLGIILAFNFSIAHFFARFFQKKNKEEDDEDGGKEEGSEEEKEEAEAEEEIEEPEEEPERPEEFDQDDLDVEKNIGRIEFVEGRDQFIDSSLEGDDEVSPEFSRQALNSSGKSLDLNGSTRKIRKPRSSRWAFPPNDLLEQSHGKADGGNIEKNFSIIQKTLEDFGIKVERGGVKTGPAVTQYSFRPAVGVKVSKILSLQNDLALALAARAIRIEAPIPGQSLFGIEIPNEESKVVRLRNMVEESKFKKRDSSLLLALGQDVSGECIFGDLAKMPHLMIAGATGTGKSVCINSIITTLLYQNSPEDLKFIMVDPKRVELSLYNGVPHLLTEVVVENGKVVNALKWAVGEMERRYRLLQDTASRDVKSYREKMDKGEKIKRTNPETGEKSEEKMEKLPYIIIVIDELADLMGSHGKEVEGAIVRIAQMARAVGIHLIVSTQRPSVEVITGLIKANITTRIAFQVATQIDSRTILDMGGAEKLLGAGDMLYLSTSAPKPKRLQGVFISESEVKKVVKFIVNQYKEKKKDNEEEEDKTEEITENSQKEILDFKESDDSDGGDELFEEAKKEIMQAKKASASFLQRRLRIGYARAARLLDILEEKGIVGPANGAKPREIYGLDEEESIGYEEPSEDQEKRDKWQI